MTGITGRFLAFVATRLDEDEAADTDHGWTQDRALREIATKRAILTEHQASSWDISGSQLCLRCINPYDLASDKPHQWVFFPCPTLRHLAAVYSDHPDYRQEWAPPEASTT